MKKLFAILLLAVFAVAFAVGYVGTAWADDCVCCSPINAPCGENRWCVNCGPCTGCCSLNQGRCLVFEG
jgi:hypothetical protein